MLDRKITHFPFPTNQDSSILKKILMESGLTSDFFKTDTSNNNEYLDVLDTMLYVKLEENNDAKIKKYTLYVYKAPIAETIEENGFLKMQLIQTTDRYLPRNLQHVPALEELYNARYDFPQQIASFLQSLDIPKTFTVKIEKIPVWSTTLPNGMKINLINEQNQTESITIEISSSPKKDLLVNIQSRDNNHKIEYSGATYWKEKTINQIKDILKDLLSIKLTPTLEKKEEYCGFKPGFLIGKRF